MSDPMNTVRDILYPGRSATVTQMPRRRTPEEEALAEARAVKAAQKRKERARLTPEERAEKRRQADANYRDAHREQRREYDREYQQRRKELGLS